MRAATHALIISLAAMVASACQGGHDNDFNCTNDMSCNLKPGGVCVTAGTGNAWCGYPDPDCPSGIRFSEEDAGDGLAGVCTEPGQTFKLTVMVGGSGAGTVTSTPAGLTCSTGTCTAIFAAGTQVSLASSVTTGAFVGWGKSCSGRDQCMVTMDADREVDALFGIPGEALWVSQLGSSGVDTGFGLAVDGNGDVIAVGQFSGQITLGTETLTSAGAKDIFVVKFTGTTGAVQWAKRYGGTLDDWGQAVTTDSSGNIYVTGLFRDVVNFGAGNVTAGGSDAFVLKLSTTGEYGWARQIGGNGYEQGFSIVATDTTVFAVGSHSGSMTLDQITVSAGGTAGSLNAFAVALATSNGAASWLKTLGGTNYDFGNGVAIDTSGNIIVTGTFTASADFGGGVLTAAGGTGDTDIFLVKLSGTNGGHLFSKRLGTTAADEATAVSADVNNNIVLVGNFRAAMDFGCTTPLTPTHTEEMFVVKYSQAGSCVWAKNFNAYATDVMLNAAGEISVTGWFANTVSFGGADLSAAGANDVFAARFSSTGSHLNSVRAGGTADERGLATAQSADGHFYVTGAFSGFAEFGGTALTSAGGDDAFVLALAPL